MYAIWTFVMKERRVPVGSGIATMYPDIELWEPCPDGWNGERARARAEKLSQRSGGVFVVRRKLSGDKWSDVPKDDWQRGITAAQHLYREDQARKAQRRLQKRLSQAGMPPPKADGS